MEETVIKVENLSKQYRLGQVGTGSLSHDINRMWHRVRGKDDPYLKIGEENDRTIKGNSEYVWALRDINFDVKHGEVLGIIGRNGSGKSTLLKILSRTTKPTTGSIKIKGRVASLLEVGTGFHPELSGKENIFLNGAILGMTKAEIKSKFDEIVDFAGVEKYIDTPVKRYSSGMYVRLAFAVAAHLEPEILIVDEVLAVGDAEFQRKALGKMKDVSRGQGKTVLFVSHNMAAIQNLCRTALWMQTGRLRSSGTVSDIISQYLLTNSSNSVFSNDLENHANRNPAKSPNPVLSSLYFFDESGAQRQSFKIEESIIMKIAFKKAPFKEIQNAAIKISVENFSGQRICILHTDRLHKGTLTISPGTECYCTLKSHRLMPGNYKLKIAITSGGLGGVTRHDFIEDAVSFEVVASDVFGTGKLTYDSQSGVVVPDAYWNFQSSHK